MNGREKKNWNYINKKYYAACQNLVRKIQEHVELIATEKVNW